MINRFDYEWGKAGLEDYEYFSDKVTYCNQLEDSPDSSKGEWYYIPEGKMIIYFGSCGNYNSPGASAYTWAEVFESDELKDFETAKKIWESYPEYIS